MTGQARRCHSRLGGGRCCPGCRGDHPLTRSLRWPATASGCTWGPESRLSACWAQQSSAPLLCSELDPSWAGAEHYLLPGGRRNHRGLDGGRGWPALPPHLECLFLDLALGKRQGQERWAQGVGGEVRYEEGKGAASRLLWGEAKEGGAGQLGAECRGGDGGFSIPTELSWGRGCRCNLCSPRGTASSHGRKLGGKLCLSINTFQQARLSTNEQAASGDSELPITRGI